MPLRLDSLIRLLAAWIAGYFARISDPALSYKILWPEVFCNFGLGPGFLDPITAAPCH